MESNYSSTAFIIPQLVKDEVTLFSSTVAGNNLNVSEHQWKQRGCCHLEVTDRYLNSVSFFLLSLPLRRRLSILLFTSMGN